MPEKADSLTVKLGARSYEIIIGQDLISSAGQIISNAVGSGSCWIVTDENIAALYLRIVKNSLAKASIKTHTIILPPGENTKNFTTVETLVNKVLDEFPERASSLIALGGGVIGDITGFASSIILRGINFVQIPTTLLSQVDSSVGGKTGINTKHGKNLIGAFYQPRLVISDTDVLNSLPKRELLSGYAEVVKYGLIRDVAFFSWLEKNGSAVINGDFDARRHAVQTSCAIKAAVVAEDEHESGARALLNFGHTFGHALEAETRFTTELLHGEAVSIGMILAIKLSQMLGHTQPSTLERTLKHFKGIGLPTGLPAIVNHQWNVQKLIGHMGYDKKIVDGQISFVLARKIGDSFISRAVDPRYLERLLQQAIG